MSDSIFNPETFLGTATEVAGATRYFPPPAKEYPRAQITKVEGKQIESKQPATLGQKYIVIEVTWELLDDEARKATEMDHPTARQSIFVDLTPQGGLDFGKNKNVPLSKLREAVGQNKSGKKWAIAHLMGQSARVIVIHDPDRTTGEPRAVVTGVAAA